MKKTLNLIICGFTMFLIFLTCSKFTNEQSSTASLKGIKTTAYIFKDATWPKSNYTLDGIIDFKFINGQVM